LGGIYDYCENNVKMFQCPMDNGPVTAPGALGSAGGLTNAASYPMSVPYWTSNGQIMSANPPSWWTLAKSGLPGSGLVAPNGKTYTQAANGPITPSPYTTVPSQSPAPAGPYPGLSYEWNPIVDGGTTNSTTPVLTTRRRNRGNDILSTLRLVNDLDNFHLAGGSLGPNVVYADGHVP